MIRLADIVRKPAGSVGAQIRRLLLGTTALALSLAAGAFFVLEYQHSRAASVQQMETLAQLVASQLGPAVSSGQHNTALDLLAKLELQPDVRGARIILPDGQYFVGSYWGDEGHSVDSDQYWISIAMRDLDEGAAHRFDALDLDVLVPIQTGDRDIGYLHIEGDLRRLNQHLITAFIVVAVAFLLLMGGVHLLSNRLQQRISEPIRKLAQAMRRVSESQDYTLRIQAKPNGEVGDLITGFNKMLGQLEDRDKAIALNRRDLEQKVAERTADLAAAKAMAEAGSRAKSQFLAIMSHEIRTPMNGVLGMTELLLGSGLPPRQRRLAETAHRSAEGLLGVIDNILDFSKIEANHLELFPEETELRPLIDDALEILADQASRKGIELVADLPPDLPAQVRCDATRLRQVLINLLSNAVKFTEQGEVRLLVRATDAVEGDITLDIEVKDTGPGIPKAQQAHVFDAFVQADGSVTRRFSGTGLGLAITRRLVELMGGTISLDSDAGQGASFRLSVKVQAVETEEPAAAPPQVLVGLRVLIIDDHTTNREILCNQLAAWKLRSECASDAEEAIALLRKAAAEQDPHRITLLDAQMRQLDGVALARQIKADPLIPDTALIIMSSADDEVALRTANAGVTGYLSKPVRQDRLLACLLDSQRGRIALAPVQTARSPAGSAFRDAYVLLAEDNRVNQEVALDMLEMLGCRVDLVQNGREAVEAYRRQRYQLVLMDCHMPLVDGFQAAAEIRGLERDEQRPRVPIIALTADVQQGIEQQCRNAGMDQYLSKPFDQNRLTQALRRWLPAAPQADAANQTIAGPPEPSDALDTRTIDELRELGRSRGKDLLGTVAALFCNDAPALITAMRDGIARADLAAIQKAAHSLRSASVHVGALTLAERCGAFETAARSGRAGDVESLFRGLEAAADEALSALERLAARSPQTASASAQARTADKGKRVLVVDDDASFRFTTREILHAEGFETAEAADGEQALFQVGRRAPDLVLLDAVLPGIDGFETCRRLRRHPNSQDIPIIIVTALDDHADAERAFEAGATGFVTKPVAYPTLIQRIRFMLRASQNEAQLRDHKAMLQTAQRVARLGYWRWDPASDRFELSENLCEMCGITSADHDGSAERFLALVCSEDRERVAAHLRAAMQDQQLTAFDYCIDGPHGEPMIVRQDIELISTADGLTLLGTVQDVTRQRHSEDQIRKMAYYDALTGLASRSHLMQHLEDLIRIARRRNEQFSILFLDLDGFKDVNDSLGHDVGDFMLVTIARRLQAVVRDVDFVARLGGDEFCILLDESRDELDAAEVASRCLETINQPIEFASQTWRPHVSIGLARFPEDGESAGMLLKAADSAMYAAKQAGKHRYAFYRPEMTEEAEQRLASEQTLRVAIEQEQFELYYQPQIELRSGRMIGVEALARWRHPQRGLVSPGEFVPTLERIGLIRDLGDWVIRTACRQAAEWLRAGLPEIRVAVNISPLHFHDADILNSVSDALKTWGLPAHNFEVEITESSVQSDTRAMIVLQQLQSLGVRISIDDFGTGYSSLGSLKHLPINTLKVDRVFVNDMLNNNEDAVMLGTIIGLAHALGYTVLAEGVEERDQAAVLAGLNCDLAQGYYFSRPVSAEQIPALLRRGSFVATPPPPPALLDAVCAGGKDV